MGGVSYCTLQHSQSSNFNFIFPYFHRVKMRENITGIAPKAGITTVMKSYYFCIYYNYICG